MIDWLVHTGIALFVAFGGYWLGRWRERQNTIAALEPTRSTLEAIARAKRERDRVRDLEARAAVEKLKTRTRSELEADPSPEHAEALLEEAKKWGSEN